MKGLWKAVSQRGDDEKYDRERERDRDRQRQRQPRRSYDDRAACRHDRDDSVDEEEGRGRNARDRYRERDRKARDERDLDWDDEGDRDRQRGRGRGRGRSRSRPRYEDDDEYDEDPQDEDDGDRRRAERQRRKEERRSQREAQQAEIEHKQAADGKSPKLAALPVNPDEERTKRPPQLMRMDVSETNKPYRLYGQFPYSHEIWLVIWGIIKIWIYIIFFISAIFISGTDYHKPDCRSSSNAEFCLISGSSFRCVDTSVRICGDFACQSPGSLQYDQGQGHENDQSTSVQPKFSKLAGPKEKLTTLTGYGCYIFNIPLSRNFDDTASLLPYGPNITEYKQAQILCLGPTPQLRDYLYENDTIGTQFVPAFKTQCNDATNCPNTNLTIMARAYAPIVVCLVFFIVLDTIICIGLCVFASNHPSEFESVSKSERWLLILTRSGFFLTQFFWFCILISYLYLIFVYSQESGGCANTLVAAGIPLVLFSHTRTYIIAWGVLFGVMTFIGSMIRQHLQMRGEMYVPSHDDELIFPCGLDCKTCRDRPQPKCCPGCFANWEECGYGTFLARRCAWTCDRLFSVTIGPLGALLERCWKKRHFIGP